MSPQITIIGLGQIGASIGMALRNLSKPVERVGYDKDGTIARAAETLGGVDRVKGLREAIKQADIVFLCLPLSEMRETLKLIGPELKEGTIVLDTAPIKAPITKWVREYIPTGCHYLGLVPSLTFEVLPGIETGLKAASPDLFKGTVMIIDIPPGTPVEVEQMAVGLVQLLGAKPMLTDFAESDGLMTMTHVLPQLTAAALLDATVDQPGWIEGRKMAGRPFLGVTGGMAYYDDPESLCAAAIENPLGVIRALDGIIASLQGLRDDIGRGDTSEVMDRLQHAFDGRERWLDERGGAVWLQEGGNTVDLPNVGDQIMQMFFGSRIFDRSRKKKEALKGRL